VRFACNNGDGMTIRCLEKLVFLTNRLAYDGEQFTHLNAFCLTLIQEATFIAAEKFTSSRFRNCRRFERLDSSTQSDEVRPSKFTAHSQKHCDPRKPLILKVAVSTQIVCARCKELTTV
jgi:hypothetical protein